MPKKVTAWKCSYCSRYRLNKAAITKHEQICFHNPDRKILEGQMAIFETMPRELTIFDSYGVPNSEWREPNWTPGEALLKKYKWWPLDEDGCLDLGYIYHEGAWCKIEGYIPPHFAPGYSWREEYIPAMEAPDAK
jgi:hypothetical protein